ncbi:E3 ubiquitin-protein ligase MARCH2 [Papilio xuthus]|uniref:E3 ubiquitin-protein ligase MARCH2 n=1 Tax=Papilio xuthus TaxID=66420 RepID=A0A194PWM3_PAPXU|nr:E3 ubiquitin-protein ligase MARCH2 [Papilio xuthus]
MDEENKINKEDANDKGLNNQNKVKVKQLGQAADDAGPSRFTPLPGEIPQTPKSIYQQITGKSKSEHSLRQFITTQDVANALKLSSLSFTPANESIKNINFKDLKIPNLTKTENSERCEPATFLDLKKFVASCFTSKDTENLALVEVPNVQNVHTAISSIITEPTPEVQRFQSPPTQIIDIVNVTNDIRVPNANLIDIKQSKTIEGHKKKTSGNLSEKSDFRLAARDSLSSIGSNVCRICMTKGRERLISPCNCKGSLANVHLSCLERWLNQVGRNHCELCGFSYPAIRTPRYTVLQALRLWFGNPRNRSHLQSDCLIFWLLSTVTAGLLAVCIVGTQYFVIEGNKFGKLDPGARKDEGISHRITETAMDFFMAIVLCGYSVTVYLLWKDHYVMWNRWRRANVNVRLLLSPDSNPVPFVPRPRYNVV